MSNDRGRLIVISGPTASGKTTLWRRLVTYPTVDFSVSATTRSPRKNEVDGKDYHFLSQDAFDALVAKAAFLEYATVHGRSYGTLRSDVHKSIEAGQDILLEIDVQGQKQLKVSGIPMLSLFVIPPSLDVLRARLRQRGTESEEEMNRRLAIVEEEMKWAQEYDHVVVNDDLEEMIQGVIALLGLEVKA